MEPKVAADTRGLNQRRMQKHKPKSRQKEDTGACIKGGNKHTDQNQKEKIDTRA